LESLLWNDKRIFDQITLNEKIMKYEDAGWKMYAMVGERVGKFWWGAWLQRRGEDVRTPV